MERNWTPNSLQMCIFVCIMQCDGKESWIPNSLQNVYFCVYNAHVMERNWIPNSLQMCIFVMYNAMWWKLNWTLHNSLAICCIFVCIMQCDGQACTHKFLQCWNTRWEHIQAFSIAMIQGLRHNLYKPNLWVRCDSEAVCAMCSWEVDIRALARGLSGCLVDTLFVDLDTPNMWYFCVYNAMGWKGIGHPIHSKCAFLDTRFWNPG